ncbi:MAG: hypothetical protein VKL39_04340 [Leptolyngbyaceae bacterium]|nr:hypothetical protein [Leptolyngbyaceae bacterium]
MTHWGDRRYRFLGIVLGLALFLSVAAHSLAVPGLDVDSSLSSEDSIQLPPLRSHPLPELLAAWNDPALEDSASQGDYFDAIAPSPLGYLVWSRFPITIFVEPPDAEFTGDANVGEGGMLGDADVNGASPKVLPPLPPSPQIHRQWYDAVLGAIAQWSVYLPLESVNESADADIRIWAVAPPLQVTFDASEPQFEPARAAETRYEFYIDAQADGTQVLAPRYDIKIKPGQSFQQIQATTRHELGHALGLWGHSPLQTDVLYASQIHAPPQISARDVRTLKAVYEHPTQLGWPLPNAYSPTG